MQPTKAIIIALSLAAAFVPDPVGYSTCQAQCTQMTRACYAAAGFTFGTVCRADATAPIAKCNWFFGVCQAICAAVTLHPTPQL